ncbi:Rrf2 family transcriptional regulator [Thiotrichales bacterium 19S3-7]|nr:Rrf2 family transcriptional regulator [Thiotrichales bacterium 19S3-7]MCF6801420.1 Rrf2 family transcriptional regulator [Thiotrichales bacterium 19S3-11]
MIRVNKLVDYSVVILVAIAKHNDQMLSARALSELTDITLPMTQKVLKRLSAGLLVDSTIGSKGGYRLKRHLADISLKDVINVLESDQLSKVKCGQLSALVQCDKLTCLKKGHWFEVEDAINEMLGSYRLDRLLDCYK